MISVLIKKIKKFIFFLYWKPYFKSLGWGAFIDRPLHRMGGKNISIGKRVTINYKSWLGALPHTNETDCKLIINDGCTIGHFCEIYATKSIIIEKNVLTADRVYISDNLHGYEDINTPIKDQPIRQINPGRIGEGSWIGVGVAVMGATIGRHCVIGANSVVTRDIPDYSVAVGIPAKVIKRYDFQSNRWRKTNADGSFV